MEITTAAVEVSLSAGTWHAHWPASGVRVGPMVAGAELATGEVTSAGASGEWHLIPATVDGRAGTMARWTPTRSDGIGVELHVADDGGLLSLTVSLTRDARVRRLRPFTGSLAIPGTGAVKSLVSGYDSWDYAGVQPAETAARTWWSGLWVREGGGAVAVHAAPPKRLATSFSTSQNAMRTLSVNAVAGGTPGMWMEGGPVDGTPMRFGHGDGEPLDLDAADGITSEAIVIGTGTDPLTTLETVAAAIGGRRPWPEPPVHGWASWYHFGSAVTPDDVVAHIGYTPPGMLVQIDDGWQIANGAWEANDRFAAVGMAGLARAVTEAGRRPGLWLAPFRVGVDTPLAVEHPDWLLDGGFGPMPEKTLDASRPEALEWLRQLGRQVRSWGYTMVKLDFLAVGGAERPDRHDPTVTGTAALRRGLEAMIDGLGPDVYVLGCGMPLGLAPGLVHSNRIGMDLDGPVAQDSFRPFPAGDVMTGIRPVARNLAARWFTAAFYAPDPDVVMGYAPWYSADQTRLLASLAAIGGGPYLLGDDFDELPPERRAILEDARALVDGTPFRPLDLFDPASLDTGGNRGFYEPGADPPSLWRSDRPDGTVVLAVCNWTHEPRTVTIEVPPGTTTIGDFWTGTETSVSGTTFEVTVPSTGITVIQARR